MKKMVRKIFVTVGIVAACVSMILLTRFVSYGSGKPDMGFSGKTKGNPQAPIKIIEYVDLRCGPCARGTLWLGDMMKAHPESIFLEVRYFPLNVSQGLIETRFAECSSRQGKFWDIFSALMSRQSQWIRHPNPEQYFLDLAGEMGLDINRLTACWQDPDVYDAIIAVKESGRRAGVTATPTYFLDGKMFVGITNLQSTLELLLNGNQDGGGPHDGQN